MGDPAGDRDADPGEIVVDARGRRCPIPTLRLRRAWETAAPGSLLRVYADDPMARIDLPHFAAQVGLRLISLDVSGASVTALFRKSPT
jgi:tRNA 2-thiouridine synthesizing protein A